MKQITFKAAEIDFNVQLVDLDGNAMTEKKTVNKAQVDVEITLGTAAVASLKGQRWVPTPDGRAQIETFSMDETYRRITLAQTISLTKKGSVKLDVDDLTFVAELIVKYMPVEISGLCLLEIEKQAGK